MSGGMDCCFNCGSEGSRCTCCRKCGAKDRQMDCPCQKKPVKKQAQPKPKSPTQEELQEEINDLLTDCWNKIVYITES
ncbi:hypothetical protein LRR18_18220, partial [Mangrovimonas sp. AS39]|uniref:hypothetical protein n=1 Tax=Mangrovimonas futianensis TaxID=2895523 RepID=UPI001E3D914A